MSIKGLSFEEQFIMAEKELFKFGNFIGSNLKNEKFRSNVYELVNNKFDGDHNVLIKDLVKNKLYEARYLKDSNSNDLDISVTVDGVGTFYPQIYIPYYEKVYDNIRARKNENLDEPIIIFHVADGITDVYDGYTYDNNSGELIEAGIMVDEEFALNNEV